MADYGTFRRDPIADAAELVVRAVSEEDAAAGPQRRAYLGTGELDRRAGILRLYASNRDWPMVSLYATGDRTAGLILRASSIASHTELFRAAQIGSAVNNGLAWGYLRLRANRSGEGRDTVMIGTDDERTRGVMVLKDGFEGLGAGTVTIGVDRNGPFLHMVDSEDRSLHLSPGSFTFEPRKPEDFNFVAADPADPNRAIYYSVLEGPEVGTYVRGTARLQDGHALVPLPDHFTIVTGETGLTVHLTPRSATSRGVAAVNLSNSELEIRELNEGTGSYDVDYLVHGVRRGVENYEVRRPRRTPPSPRSVAYTDVEEDELEQG